MSYDVIICLVRKEKSKIANENNTAFTIFVFTKIVFPNEWL